MLANNAQFFAENAAAILLVGGFVIGLIFGAIVMSTNFCTMGAVADIVSFGDYRRFRSWVLAAAVALVGAQMLDAASIVDLDRSIYLRHGLHWVGNIGGGLIFGFGMALAGGCPSRNLARAGAGDIRALMTVVVIGVFAIITHGGLLAPLRLAAESRFILPLPEGVTTSVGDLAGFVLGLDAGSVRPAVAILIATAAFAYCFKSAAFRASPRHMLAGLGIGALAAAGWAVTGLVYDELSPTPFKPMALSFIRPAAETIAYVLHFTGIGPMTYSMALMFGALVGAMAIARLSGRFRIQGYADSADVKRNLAGAAMMGIGGVLALGCSIGQGVTGVSTMAAGSFLAFAAMALGVVAGVRYLERGFAGLDDVPMQARSR
jgi:uncharacterized membrane protein YedE/YeeE